MRVTHAMVRETMLRALTRNVSKLEDLQEQITTGQKINRPSEDPVTAAAILRLDSSTAQAEQHITNVDDALSWLGMTDSALSSVGDSIHRARELALAAPNSTVSATDRDAIVKELDGLIGQVVQSGNVQLAGQYIFSGMRTKTPAFDASTSPPTYNGDSYGIMRVIDVQSNVQVNVTGDAAIQPTLNALVAIRDAVQANDHPAIRAGIDQLDAAQTTLLGQQAQVGARVNRLEAQRDRLLDIKINLTKLRSEQQDVDYAEAVSDYAVQEVVYKAALQMGAKSIQPSLIDYLR